MGRRITRAKAKIKAARIPYRVPSAEDLPARVSGVLAVLFPVFNEGYLECDGPDTDLGPHDLIARSDPAHSPDPRPPAGRRRGGRAAGADAPHRGPPHRPGLDQRRTGPRRAGPWGLGRGADRRGSSAGCWPGRRGRLRVATRSSQRSTPYTPPPATSATPTGRRSSPPRPARPPRPLADHCPQPGHRGRRARRPGGGTGGRRPS